MVERLIEAQRDGGSSPSGTIRNRSREERRVVANDEAGVRFSPIA